VRQWKDTQTSERLCRGEEFPTGPNSMGIGIKISNVWNENGNFDTEMGGMEIKDPFQ